MITHEPERFFDGDAGYPSRMHVVLEQDFEDPVEKWQLLKRIGYLDRHHAEPFVVPPDTATFRTDLTSVPMIFRWLVPRTGAHLAAALLHDGLVMEPGEPRTYLGPDVTRIQADRILRDAMADLDTPLTRRWLIWTAVTLASVSTVRPRALAALMFLCLAVVPLLGVVATLDLLDVWNVLPWMGERSWPVELLNGAIAAVVLPLVLMVPWRLAHLYRAGIIAALSIAFLLHVTIAVAVVSALYWVLERLID